MPCTCRNSDPDSPRCHEGPTAESSRPRWPGGSWPGRLRKAMAPYLEHARSVRRPQAVCNGRVQAPSGSKTLFSQLDVEEKDRFRKWADMPTARRIGDSRVQEWIDAGRP